MTKLKVLVWDIETAPGEAYFWSAKTRFIPHSMVKNPPFMLCWSAMWLDGKSVISDSLAPDEVAQRDDSRIVTSITSLLQEADVVLAHNGDAFDLPWVRGRAWANNLEPLGPIQSIDTKTASARDFKLPHNNLDALAKARGYGAKTKTDFSWWTDILEGSEAAMRRMLRYNRRDVRILRDVYLSMMPHMQKLPRLIETNAGLVCPWCGSTDLQKRGKKRTVAYTYQRYQCNECKRYPSFRTHDGSHVTNLRPT